MTSVMLGQNPVNVEGSLPTPGETAPDFTLVGSDFAPITLADLAGKNVVMSIFPSMDTGVCATAIRTFNERAAGLDNTVVLCVSADLPMRAAAFCELEGIENCVFASTFRSPDFAPTYGVAMTDGKWAGLTARAVVVIGADGKVVHRELVGAIGQEPDYDAALTALD